MKYLIITLLSLVGYSSTFGQSDTQVWGELFAESVYGASVNVKKNKMVYSLGFNHEYDNFFFGTDFIDINRIDLDVHRVSPIVENKLDLTYGAGVGYGYGEQFELIERDFFPGLDEPVFDTINYSSIMGNLSAKFNFYPTKNFGIGTGGRFVVGEDYNKVFPQIRLLFGTLRD